MLSARVTPAEQTLTKSIDGEVIALNLASGHYYKLNPTASAVWNVVQKESSVERILEEMLSRFDAAPEEVRRDLVEVLGFFEREGLVTIAHDPTKGGR